MEREWCGFGFDVHDDGTIKIVVPYWSIDLLYGLSFLLCRNRHAVDTHGRRLLTAQLVAVACFLLFPLHFSFARPAVDGFPGTMFTLLAGFDQPFNQAPSLHIALLVVLWVRYAAACRGFLLWLTHLWAVLIGVSVLTTYQHHFFDLPTGALLGLLCLWLWPDETPSPLAQWRFTRSPARRRLAGFYLCGSMLGAALAGFGGMALWLIWPAVSFGLLGLIYLGLGGEGFQKQAGRLSTASTWLQAPYIFLAWLNSRLWTWRQPAPVAVADGVWLGRMPGRSVLWKGGFRSLLDLCPELPAPSGAWTVISLPWLDLLPPAAQQLVLAADAIEKLRAGGPVLVCCALGYSRSATAVAAWLIRTGRAAGVDQAIARLAVRRRQIVIGAEQRAALQALVQQGVAHG